MGLFLGREYGLIFLIGAFPTLDGFCWPILKCGGGIIKGERTIYLGTKLLRARV